MSRRQSLESLEHEMEPLDAARRLAATADDSAEVIAADYVDRRSPQQIDGDRFEWCVLFGGTAAKVKTLMELPTMEAPHQVLKRNFEDTGLLFCQVCHCRRCRYVLPLLAH